MQDLSTSIQQEQGAVPMHIRTEGWKKEYRTRLRQYQETANPADLLNEIFAALR